VTESRDTCLDSRRLETWFTCLGLGSVSTLVCRVLAVVRSCHVPCLMTVSPSGLFCVETLAFLPECRPLSFYLLTVKRLFLWLLSFYGYNVSLKLHIGNVLVSKILTTSQSRRNLILNVLARLMSFRDLQCLMSQTFERRLSLVLSQPNPKYLGLSRVLTPVSWQMSRSRKNILNPSLVETNYFTDHHWLPGFTYSHAKLQIRFTYCTRELLTYIMHSVSKFSESTSVSSASVSLLYFIRRQRGYD